MLCLHYDAYVCSSTKLEIRAEQFLPGRERQWVKRVGRKVGERNDLNNVHTCE
jgi:hypothetical protein